MGGHNTCVNIHQKWFGIRCLTFFSLFKIFLESLNDNNKKEEFLTALLFLVVFAALAITDYYAALKNKIKKSLFKNILCYTCSIYLTGEIPTQKRKS